ncbi:SPRY domain-containing SOCS box protein 3 [Trichonephila inaurata madagascariensis]|uniref:SPRY domain-containing SOCS box protein 3 n=1 Tax=Trichonephila inaurata madagascariensis TaxID=2747483 RepID=A0A8X6XFS1_9ARAC|nr:SPRY domain-containing SOCS box protein 3 [Trichonephila inaurata madagascariensis]
MPAPTRAAIGSFDVDLRREQSYNISDLQFIMSLDETTRPILGHNRALLEAYFGAEKDSEMEISQDKSVLSELVEWTWDESNDKDFVVLLNNNRDVTFHRDMSGGTAVVRGTQPMSNDQYYWEVKMISPVYGTDMMVGVGTAEASMNQVHDRFISLLGNDNKTWGLSYTGSFHHNGRSRDYTTRFGQGSVIGIHLDMWNGTLSFYKNGKHLGIASRGLKGKTLYAMASSTAACSGMRIVRSCSFPSSLQFICCTKLRELIPDEKNVLREIFLRNVSHNPTARSESPQLIVNVGNDDIQEDSVQGPKDPF